MHVFYYFCTCVHGMSKQKLGVGYSSHWSGMESELRPTSNLLVNHKGQRVKLSDQAGGLVECCQGHYIATWFLTDIFYYSTHQANITPTLSLLLSFSRNEGNVK